MGGPDIDEPDIGLDEVARPKNSIGPCAQLEVDLGSAKERSRPIKVERFSKPKKKDQATLLKRRFFLKMRALREEARPQCLKGDLLLVENMGRLYELHRGRRYPLKRLGL